MTRSLLTACFACAVALLQPLSHGALAQQNQDAPQVIDGIAAVVNGEVITFSQVRGLVGPRERLLRSQFRGEELQKKIQEARKEALQDLIDRQLIVQEF